jgi:non-ribosomal peptide synthetase component E (peptide arylation enzyme)
MFHLASVAAVLGVSVIGGTHIIVPKFDSVAVLAAIEQHRITDTALIQS